MLQGNLFCTGNSLSLKNEYGLGFRFCVQTKREVDLITLIQEMLPDGSVQGIPDVMVDTAPGDARTFLIPKERSQDFTKMLEVLEDQITRDPDSALVLEYSVSHTTLEEVFMSIVRGQKAQSSVSTASTGYSASEGLDVTGSATQVLNDRGFVSLAHSKDRAMLEASPGGTRVARTSSAAALAKRTGGCKSQVSALVHKNMSFQKRQRCTNFCQVIIPAILLMVVVLIQHIVDSTFEAKSKWEVKRCDFNRTIFISY